MVTKLTYSVPLAFALIFAVSLSAEQLPCNSPSAVDYKSCTSLSNKLQECIWCEQLDSVIANMESTSFVCVDSSSENLIEGEGMKCKTRQSDKIRKKNQRQHATTSVKIHVAGADDDGSSYDDATYSDDDAAPPTDDAAPTDDATDDMGPFPYDDQTPTDDASPDADDDQAPASDDREGPDDDQSPADDDQAPPSDDATPPDDDNAPPNDDVIPDDFWTCLAKKSSSDCATANCTWCDTKGGFGVCMTGPAADAAKNSSWFSCSTAAYEIAPVRTTFLRATKPKSSLLDPYDPSCIQAFLIDQTEAGCIAASDENGQTCEWCSISGMANVCLTPDQAAMGAAIGISCDDSEILTKEKSPYDFSCALSYLQDQSKENCLKTLDSDGVTCQFCSIPGSLDICLSHDQVDFAAQLGIDCSDKKQSEIKKTEDPFDTACLLAFMQDQSKEGCIAATDSDGQPCQFCSLQGSVSLCLNQEQAEFSEQFGIDCDSQREDKKSDPVSFPPDFFSCLESYQEGDCRQTDCTWCNTQVGIGFCLSNEAAEATKQCTFFDCEFVKIQPQTSIEAVY